MSAADELHKIISEWHNRTAQVQNAHYDAGSFYEKRFLQLGIPVIVLSALVGGTEVIVPVDFVEPAIAKNISGVISLLIAVLAGLQTFLKLSQRSERHRMAGARYGEIRRSLEVINITCEKSIKDGQAEIESIQKKMDSLAIESPELPQSILNKYRPEHHKSY